MKSLIKRYLNGTLSEQELETWGEQIISAKLDRDKRKAWTKQLKNNYGVERNPPARPRSLRKQGWAIIGLAASLLFLLSFFFWASPATSNDYLAQVDQHLSELQIMGNPSVLRKGTADFDRIRAQATRAYVDQAYAQSIPLWQELVDKKVATNWDYFYLGLCHLQNTSPNWSQSIAHLEKSMAMDGPKDELHWVLALAYLRSGDAEAGLNQLDALIQRGAYQLEVAQTLRQMLMEDK